MAEVDILLIIIFMVGCGSKDSCCGGGRCRDAAAGKMTVMLLEVLKVMMVGLR